MCGFVFLDFSVMTALPFSLPHNPKLNIARIYITTMDNVASQSITPMTRTITSFPASFRPTKKKTKPRKARKKDIGMICFTIQGSLGTASIMNDRIAEATGISSVMIAIVFLVIIFSNLCLRFFGPSFGHYKPKNRDISDCSQLIQIPCSPNHRVRRPFPFPVPEIQFYD